MGLVTVRGAATVRWKPAYDLALSSTDGTSLDADGKTHPLVATLTSTGAAVANRVVRLTTNPTGRVGHKVRKRTNSSGVVSFLVSDEDDEVVAYTADLPPLGDVTGTPVSITWGEVGLVQSAIQAYDATGTLALGQPVGQNRLLVLVIASKSSTTGVVVTGAGSGSGQTYTLAGSAHQYTNPALTFNNIAVYYRVAGADGAGEQTVDLTAIGVNTAFNACLLEYAGYDHTSPLDDTNGNANATGFPTTWTANSVPVAGTGELVVAGFMNTLDDNTGNFSATNGYAVVKAIENGGGEPNPSDVNLWVVTKTASAASTPTAGMIGGDKYAAAAASFKKPT